MNQTKTTADIGSRLEMMVDDWLIDSQQNVALQLQQPTKREVVWQREKPWEGMACAYFRVMQDGHRIRLYHRAGTDAVANSVTCHVESLDGINFERTHLNLHEFEGSKANNITFRGGESDSFASHNLAPFRDTNPNAKPEEKYKAIGGYRLEDYTKRQAYAFSSWDGLHWKKMQDEPILTEGKLDSMNLAFWDDNIGMYRCYSRYMAKGADGKEYRAIQSCTSHDFLNWTPMVHNTYDEQPPEFYTSATTPAPNAPHIYLAFPKRFMPKRQKLPEHQYGAGVSDAMFMSSRDGIHWDRPFKEAWVKPGLDQRNWTERNNMTAWGIVQTGDEFSFYLSEHNHWIDTRLRRYTLPRDRFASIHAGVTIGEWTTRPLLFTGSQLNLNYSTSAAGSIRIEVQDETGKPFPGLGLDDFPELYGDELDAVAQWQSTHDLSALQNKPVRLRFVMQEADIFALRFS